MKLALVYLILLSSILFGCAKKNERETLSLEEVVFYKSFPKTIELKEKNIQMMDEIGLSAIKIIGDYLILSHGTSYWSIYNKDTLEKLTDCLSIGEGPGEFYQVPYSSGPLYRIESDSLVAYLQDATHHRVMRLNIPKEIEVGEGLSIAFESESLKNDLWAVIPLQSDKFLLHKPNEDFTSFSRMILTEDSLYELTVTKPLSMITVDDESKVNFLAKATRFNPENKKVVEAMCHFNQINLYSVEDDWGKTICIGDELDDLDQATSINPLLGRYYTYYTIAEWDNGFGAVYLGGARDMELDTGLKSDCEIHIFNWDGIPVAKILVGHNVKSFDIDLDNNTLYVIDKNEDKIIAYDANEIIRLLKSNSHQD